jgi:hypothetical protein
LSGKDDDRMKKRIERICGKIFDDYYRAREPVRLPAGYNPLEYIRGGLYHWIAVPFHRAEVYCQLRCPNATQIEQCGNISNITGEKEKNKKPEHDDIILIRNYQEALCRISLNKPTFDEITALVGLEDGFIKNKRKELAELQTEIETQAAKMTETEKNALLLKIKTIELMIGFLLPDDTMAFITKWAMGNDVSDIKKINRESFLRAASLAKAHNKAPSDYLSGVFTDYNKIEIDTYAFGILNEYLAETKIVRGTYRWIGGKKGNRNG